MGKTGKNLEALNSEIISFAYFGDCSFGWAEAASVFY